MINKNFKKQKNFFYLIGFVIFLLTFFSIILIFSLRTNLVNINQKEQATITEIKQDSQARMLYIEPDKEAYQKEQKRQAENLALSEFGTTPLKANSFQDYARKFCFESVNNPHDRDTYAKTEETPFTIDQSKIIVSKYKSSRVRCIELEDPEQNLNDPNYIKIFTLTVPIFNDKNLINDELEMIYFHDGVFRPEGHDGLPRFAKVGELLEEKNGYKKYLYFETAVAVNEGFFYRRPYIRAIKAIKNSNNFTFYASYSLDIFRDNMKFSDDLLELCNDANNSGQDLCMKNDALQIFKEKYLNSNKPEIVDALAKIDRVMTAIGEN